MASEFTAGMNLCEAGPSALGLVLMVLLAYGLYRVTLYRAQPAEGQLGCAVVLPLVAGAVGGWYGGVLLAGPSAAMLAVVLAPVALLMIIVLWLRLAPTGAQQALYDALAPIALALQVVVWALLLLLALFGFAGVGLCLATH